MSCSSGRTPRTQQEEEEGQPPPRSWSSLPSELIRCIHWKLDLPSDNIRFRAVCKWWRRSTTPRSRGSQHPWLLLAYDTRRCSSHRFYSPAERDVHVLPLPKTARRTRCCGSSFGWLLLLSTNPNVSLLNPITGASIALPPLTAFPRIAAFCADAPGREYVLSDPHRPGALFTASSDDMQRLFLRKAFLSSDPTTDPGSVLLAIRFDSKMLAYCRVGGDSWTEIDLPAPFGHVLDAAYHREKFYLSCSSGRVAVFDAASEQLNMVTPSILTGCECYYIVKTPSGDLLLIGRHVEGLYGEWRPGRLSRTTRFRVFKLDLRGGKGSGVELDSLGDFLVFLGMNHSICVSATASASCGGGSPGLKAGSIYYVDMNVRAGRLGTYDLSAFNLDTGATELLLRDVHNIDEEWTMTAWMMPNLC